MGDAGQTLQQLMDWRLSVHPLEYFLAVLNLLIVG